MRGWQMQTARHKVEFGRHVHFIFFSKCVRVSQEIYGCCHSCPCKNLSDFWVFLLLVHFILVISDCTLNFDQGNVLLSIVFHWLIQCFTICYLTLIKRSCSINPTPINQQQKDYKQQRVLLVLYHRISINTLYNFLKIILRHDPYGRKCIISLTGHINKGNKMTAFCS